MLAIFLTALLVTSSLQFDSELFNYVVIQPKQCLRQYCPSQISAVESNTHIKKCVQECETDGIVCLAACLPKEQIDVLGRMRSCSKNSGCLSSNTQIIDESWTYMCLLNTFHSDTSCQIAMNKLNDCSVICGTDEECWNRCPKPDAVSVAYQFYQKVNGICFPQYLTDAICFRRYCPTQWQKIKNENELQKANTCYKKCNDDQKCWQKCFPAKETPLYIESASCAKENNCEVMYNPAFVEVITLVAGYLAGPAWGI